MLSITTTKPNKSLVKKKLVINHCGASAFFQGKLTKALQWEHGGAKVIIYE